MIPTVIEYKPQSQLSPYIESYLFIQCDEDFNKSILPHHSFVLTIKLKGNHHYRIQSKLNHLPPISLSGLRKTVKHNTLSKGTEIIIVKFQPWGAFSLFNMSMYELNEIGISGFDLFAKTDLNDLHSKLQETKDNHSKIHHLENFLLKTIKNKTMDRRILESISQMNHSQGTIKIKDIASIVNLSIDTFEKKFREVIGNTPKQFSSIIRMNSVIREIPKYNSFTKLAYDFGYFDQSHFIKEFKSFTGKTPTEFLA
ncbi:AraC family transcriptional regulator [Leptospira kanakyensis]|uniref:AraC family transcriptional regulator n=1 Tax=Leptospira kanakyensis TaxID=2484968 RepID=A0A6N4PWI5_9LEPT|nr:helix-turn-helix transcriptional regulator [Leptospira kanakyensis]TGK49897.1 AraC family transcriptional regulator [Leptospira kanakyensis]TGK58586.1 AraC family transcriptional regulator [Leptospira kanakyensis]TGK69035.1 AraC family transcriptional regulator [Leptospira kanakyensis]